jgi:hypothetical protein
MSRLLYLCSWSVDVVILSAVVALFEIGLERDEGWASGLSQNRLGRRLWQGSLFVHLLEKPYLTAYHFLMFGGVVPLILATQCALIRHVWVGRTFIVRNSGILMVWQVGSAMFSPLFASVAAWLAICTIEDFLWFALNWYYPKSLQDLLSGNIWWHTQWVQLGQVKVPRFYIFTPALACVVLTVSACMTW